MVVVNNDYIEVTGPTSLAELVAALGQPNVAETRPDGELSAIELGGEVYCLAQYDEVDTDTWPYMVQIRSRNDDPGPVRAASLALLDSICQTGWRFRLTSDADDILVERAATIP